MKKLVTHIRPHLDDICALWLLKRLLPGAEAAEISFVPTNERGGDVNDDAETMYVGVGRGRFDEHKGDIGQCATSLVFAYLKEKAAVPDGDARAFAKIVDWVLLEDTGKLNSMANRSFSIPAIIEGHFDRVNRDSASVTELVFTILDDLLLMQKNEVTVEDAWAKRVEFDSRFGRTAAVSAKARQLDAYAYSHGCPLVLIVDPALTYHTFRADAASDIDLTSVWEKLKEVDAEASWYFHHSKKMLICGGDHAPYAVPSKLTLEGMIALVK
jgi:hypothetical protein